MVLSCLLGHGLAAQAQLAHGIDPTNLGKGDWIWEMSACQTALGVSTPQAVINYEAAKGMRWITVKGADGGDTASWTQFNTTLISEAHAAGLKIFAWAYVYGNKFSNLQGEINAALYLLGLGADGFIIDAESEYEGQSVAAAQYCQAIRAQYPNTFLAYAPFPYISLHQSYPYIEFGTNCHAVMPQDYWTTIGVSVTNMVRDMDTEWRNWQNGLNGIYTNAIKPIVPIGQGYSGVPGSEITAFVNLLKNDASPASRTGYRGVSFWSCQHHSADEWNAIGAATIGINPPAIATPPASLLVTQGSPAALSVLATGAGTLHYQWRFNQTNIPGATATNYAISHAQPANAGGYSVVVTNLGGSTISAFAFLSVLSPLTNAAASVLAPSGMLDWWPADANPNDIFGAKNGTPQNGFSYAAGKQGLAFAFDGSTSYLSVSATNIPAPWTACFWVNRRDAPGTSAALIADGIYSLKLEQYNGTRQVGMTQLGMGDYNFGYTVPQNTWVHLAFVGNGAQTLLYTNGVLQSSQAVSIPLPRTYLGVAYSSSSARFIDYMLGSLDEIALFNRALSSSEINAIYSAGSAGMVRAPEFVGLVDLVTNRFTSMLRGLTGKAFSISATTNLINWIPLAPLSNPTGAVQFTDSTATEPNRLYRASQP